MKIHYPSGFHNRPVTNHPVHIIERAWDSIPATVVFALKAEIDESISLLQSRYPDYHLQGTNDARAFILDKEELMDQYQARFDDLLHQFANRAMTFEGTEEKRIIINSWLNLEARGLIDLFAVSVMSNHVHILCAHPLEGGRTPFGKLLTGSQRFTSTKLNRLHNSKGRKVWVPRGFDRDVRPGKFEQVLWYIINNPVKAGLTTDPLNWIGTYVKPGLLAW